MTTQENRANRALEAALAWARAKRESDHRERELWAVRRAAALELAGAPPTKVAETVLESAANALHEACVREDAAEERLKELANEILDESCEGPAPTGAGVAAGH